MSVIFIASFIGALHNPGPRSVPLAFAGSQAQASALRSALAHQAPGGFIVTAYPTETAARNAISDRSANAALVPRPRAELLLVATAAGKAMTDATVSDVHAAVRGSGLRLVVQNIRPLHSSDPEGLSQVFFVIALVAPSMVFGRALATQIAKDLHPLRQLAMIAVYAAVIGAVAITFADAVIGALTGAPWGLFGIGTLLAFTAAVAAAAASRWAGGAGYLVIFLILIPIGVASSGTTLGPNMITPWYADVGKGLPVGAGLPAVQNTVYFNANAITTQLLTLSAWALGGAILLVMAGVLHWPMPGERSHASGHASGTQPRHAVTAGRARRGS